MGNYLTFNFIIELLTVGPDIGVALHRIELEPLPANFFIRSTTFGASLSTDKGRPDRHGRESVEIPAWRPSLNLGYRIKFESIQNFGA